MRSFISRKGHFVEGKMFVEWSKSFNKKNNDDDDVVLNGNSFQQLLRWSEILDKTVVYGSTINTVWRPLTSLKSIALVKCMQSYEVVTI